MKFIQLAIRIPDNVHSTYGWEFYIPPTVSDVEQAKHLLKEIIFHIRTLINTSKEFKQLTPFFQGFDPYWVYIEFLSTNKSSTETVHDIIVNYTLSMLKMYPEIEDVNMI